MPTKRQILAELGQKELQRLVDLYELEVSDRRVKENLVEVLAKSRMVSIEDVLPKKAQKKTAKGKKTVADFPHLVKEWHPTKNGDLKPKDLHYGSGKKVWWQCSKDNSHEWDAVVANRAKIGVGCPVCSGHKVIAKTSLFALNPSLASEWHPDKNDDLTPEHIRPGSNKKVWWRCSKDPSHEWKTSVSHRSTGQGCPICSNRIVVKSNSLFTTNPQLAAEWHPTKNRNLTPDKVTSGSNKRVWWRCSKDPAHEWKSVISYRKSGGGGCPHCPRKPQDVTFEKSLQGSNPSLVSEWHPVKNGDLKANQIRPGSHLKVWWKCSRDQTHEWEATVHNRTQGNGCPICAGKIVTRKNSLQLRYPNIATEWHPDKNGNLTPDKVLPGSHFKVWWQCSKDPSHEWEAIIGNRTRLNRGCPYCAGQKASDKTSLTALYPSLVAEWHPEKNGDLTPDRVTAGSGKKVWWRCSLNPTHEWKTAVYDRVYGTGCPQCPGPGRKYATEETSLRTTYPHIASEWHAEKNAPITPDDVTAGSNKKFWWKCRRDQSHEWEASVSSRTRGTNCPYCSGNLVSDATSLSVLYPEIASEWHPDKNIDLRPNQVRPGSNIKVWWRCSKDPSHEWITSANQRTRGRGCPYCAGQRVALTTSLRTTHPVLAAEWHPYKNGDLSPDKVMHGSDKKVWWQCSRDNSHTWQAAISNRVGGRGCPICAGKLVIKDTSLLATHPVLAAEWHPYKNGDLSPDKVRYGSGKKIWWICSKNPSHEWQSTIANRTFGTGCPACNYGWSVPAIRGFVSSLTGHLASLTPAELYLLFQQNGLLSFYGVGKSFVMALATGRFPIEEIEKFIDNQPSLVDKFLKDQELTLEAVETADEKASVEDIIDQVVDESVETDERELPVVQVKDALGVLDSPVVTSADEEAVEFLLTSAKEKLWRHVFVDEEEAIRQAENFAGDEYSERVRTEFLGEYRRAKSLRIPKGYAFKVNGQDAAPNLMQRLVALRVQEHRRVGNWSGTGAGKTLSAILASRVVGSKLTVICCPNSVVDGWRNFILGIYPDSEVASKTFFPKWQGQKNKTPRYLVLNYESFQQPESPVRVKEFVDSEKIDFVVVDEIHFTKQRHVENMSLRKKLVTGMIVQAGERNPNLHVIGMSATPVINNLQEGKSLVEMVVGTEHEDLKTKATVPNCMRLHQKLVTLGTRWMPKYDIKYEQLTPEIDCSEYIEEVRALGKSSSPLALEKILTKARLPVILENVKPKTLIYTHYIEEIDRMLRESLEEAGWRTGFYTGEDKSGLDAFIRGDLDVLIGSSAIGTGVDGLQNVCDRLIVNVLPWTAAEFEQLKGRIFRQGQFSEKVTMVVPLTYAEVNGQRWSWCETKMQRLKFKKSIADASVDGVVPEGHLRTPAQALQDVMGWLERLKAGEMQVISRPKIQVPLPDTDDQAAISRRRAYGDFSKMNHRWNQTNSDKTHERLLANPEEWEQYHTLYREARNDWVMVPFEEMIRWCDLRSDYVIGDFGCGEAKLAEALSDKHTVHSFDHVAINERVVACDMAHVPLDDGELDVAIFSLSLMGSNFTDYIREAYRTLKLDGHLHIVESTSRFTDLNGFMSGLKALGFGGIEANDMWKFTHIHAIKTERRPKEGVEVRF